MRGKKAQVWVETVIYTLIALALIGTVLAFVRPKIEEIQDKLTIDQSLEMMGDIDSKINLLAQGSTGNQRLLELKIKQGELQINAESEKLLFILEESKKQYSEPGKKIQVGNVEVETTKIGETYTITLTNDYSNYDLTFSSEQIEKSLTASPTLYKLSVANKGKQGCIDDCIESSVCSLGQNAPLCITCKSSCKTNLDFKIVN